MRIRTVTGVNASVMERVTFPSPNVVTGSKTVELTFKWGIADVNSGEILGSHGAECEDGGHLGI